MKTKEKTVNNKIDMRTNLTRFLRVNRFPSNQLIFMGGRQAIKNDLMLWLRV